MWIETIVMPREDAHSQRFHGEVLHFLKAHHLEGAVRWISEPGALPLVTLHCTQNVLEQLRRSPRFEAGGAMPLELHS